MEQRVSLVTLGVSDLERARRFYRDGLGWQPGFDSSEVVFFQTGGSILALWSRTSLAEDAGVQATDKGFAGMTLAHNVRAKDEVDQILAEAARAGGTITKPAKETDWGGYSGYFADPDGHLWEVAWNPGWTVHPDGRVTLEPTK